MANLFNPAYIDPNSYIKFLTKEELEIWCSNAVHPPLNTQNFKINTWNYNYNTVPLLKPEDLVHEWPGSSPYWEELESHYKSAAIGYSKELQGISVGRLCTFLSLRARPSNDAFSVFNMHMNQFYKHSKENEGHKTDTEYTFRFPLVLTGQFIDMPDGRWHYVYVKEHIQLNTVFWYWRYLPRPEYETYKELYEWTKEFMGFATPEDFESILKNYEVFKFGFVREDLISFYEDYEINGQKVNISFRREIYGPKYEYPMFYNYDYQYSYNAENGYSYLYILLPGSFLRGDKLDYPLTNVTQRIYKWNPDIDSHLRINAYPNGGDPNFMEDWADEIKADLDIENGTSDHNPSTEVVEKTVLAGAGVLALGLLLLKNNM